MPHPDTGSSPHRRPNLPPHATRCNVPPTTRCDVPPATLYVHTYVHPTGTTPPSLPQRRSA
ncbi:hypothetical protein BKA93DRAFT_792747 [Sparassis latifolia]